jgi:hypothetical protein
MLACNTGPTMPESLGISVEIQSGCGGADFYICVCTQA